LIKVWPKELKDWGQVPRWAQWPLAIAGGAAMVGVTLLVRLGIGFSPGDHPLTVLFIVPVLLCAFVGGWRAGIVATVFAGVVVDYFLLPPFGFGIERFINWMQLLMLVLISMSTTFIIEALHRLRKKTQESLELMRVTLRSIGDGVIVTDARGAVISLNAEAERLTGWKTPEAAGRPLPEVFHIINCRTRVAVESPVEQILRLGAVMALPKDTVLIARDGGELPIDDSGAPIRRPSGEVLGVVLVFRDFTENKRAEEANTRAREEWERTFDSVPDLIAILDNQHRIVRVNKAMARRLGRSTEAYLGMECYQCIHGDSIPLASCPHAMSLKDGMEHTAEIHEVILGGDFLVTNTPLRDAEGKMIGAVHVSRDITERKRFEKNMRLAREAAEAANRAKDEFLAVLSHELRNPLNPVLATATMLRNDGRFDADTREQLEVICRNAELEARLIDDLLDVTRIERGKVELDRRPIELGTVIRRAVEVCAPDIEAAQLQFAVVPAEGSCRVDADAARLQQVFWNVLKNAIKFTPAGGRVEIRTRRDGDGAIVAEISDSGQGIEPGNLGIIFNAFEQAGQSNVRQFGGLGLGLAISKALVELHGGTIRACSDGPGKGATFVIRLALLPAETDSAPDGTRPQTATPTAPLRPLRILLVEDHGDTARVMYRLLTAEGHEVHSAANMAGALELAGRHRFDLLLSDLGLPDGSGWELMRELHSRGVRVPAIAVSGYGQDMDLQKSREAGFAAHLTKPVSLTKLAEAMTKVVGNA
jgi:two-component system, chemotaxis family, CheB/CheR fusion protein